MKLKHSFICTSKMSSTSNRSKSRCDGINTKTCLFFLTNRFRHSNSSNTPQFPVSVKSAKKIKAQAAAMAHQKNPLNFSRIYTTGGGGGGFSAKFRAGVCRPQFQKLIPFPRHDTFLHQQCHELAFLAEIAKFSHSLDDNTKVLGFT